MIDDIELKTIHKDEVDCPAQRDIYLTKGDINTFPLSLVGLCWGCGLIFGLMLITV